MYEEDEGEDTETDEIMPEETKDEVNDEISKYGMKLDDMGIKPRFYCTNFNINMNEIPGLI